MHVDWPRLLLALALLLTPVGLLHGRQVHYRPVSRDWDGHWLRTLLLWTHAFDLLRAAAGGWLLMGAFHQNADAVGLWRFSVLSSRIAILSVATVLQALVCREPEAAHAPFAFAAGLVVGTLPPLVAGFSLVLAIALALGGNAPPAFFPVLSLGIVATGALFTRDKIIFTLITLALAVLMPWLLTLLFSCHFVGSYRAKPKTAVEPPPR